MVICEVPLVVLLVCVVRARRFATAFTGLFFFFGARLTAALPFFLLIGSPLLR
jgi:hypothetical protein